MVVASWMMASGGETCPQNFKGLCNYARNTLLLPFWVAFRNTWFLFQSGSECGRQYGTIACCCMYGFAFAKMHNTSQRFQRRTCCRYPLLTGGFFCFLAINSNGRATQVTASNRTWCVWDMVVSRASLSGGDPWVDVMRRFWLAATLCPERWVLNWYL